MYILLFLSKPLYEYNIKFLQIIPYFKAYNFIFFKKRKRKTHHHRLYILLHSPFQTSIKSAFFCLKLTRASMCGSYWLCSRVTICTVFTIGVRHQTYLTPIFLNCLSSVLAIYNLPNLLVLCCMYNLEPSVLCAFNYLNIFHLPTIHINVRHSIQSSFLYCVLHKANL